MLVLSRKVGESIAIGDNVVVTVAAVHGKVVRLGITAPAQVAILRTECRENWDDEPLRPSRPLAGAEPGPSALPRRSRSMPCYAQC